MSQAESSLALTACDREPIHIPGAIQPHGVLVVLDAADLSIKQIAGDTGTWLGQAATGLLGQALDIQLGGANLERLAVLSRTQLAPRPSFVFEVEAPGGTLDVSAHMSGGQIVLELERRLAGGPAPLERVQSMTGTVQSSMSVREMLDSIASEVQKATGFDRVMVYRFAADDSGHVAAEARSSAEIESFLDLHYPASDIPQQARALYLSNWIRAIPDVHYRPAPIEPADNPNTGRPLDLSFSALRSVSPIHLQYLANMGVAASLSLSLIVQGRLWGLIACHHSSPRYLDSRLRAALELFAQVCSLQLATQLELEESRLAATRRDFQDVLFAALAQQGFPAGLTQHASQLRQLVAAAGVAVQINGETATEGAVPDRAVIARLIEWLNDQPQQGIWATDRLAERWPPAAAEIRTAAGLLAVSISREPRDYVLWFLPEMRSTVTWAGNPDKPVTEVDGRLSPRKSFASWVESVTGRSRPWLGGEIDAATRLRVALLEFVVRHVDELARERDALVKRQDLLMAELDHRVKNILTTIQALVRFSGKSAESLAEFTKALERRLLSMSRAHDLLMFSRWQSASLHRLVREELSPFCPPDAATFRLEGEDCLLQPSAALSLSLLLHELATNAAKYGALSVRKGTVTVANEILEVDGQRPRLVLRWIESNGPRVTPPTRRGFGRVLLERVFEGANDSHVNLQFPPEGVRCTIEMDAERVLSNSPSPRAAAPAAVDAVHQEPLAGLKVLVAEDDGLIALFIQDILGSAGAKVVGPFSSVENAMQAAGHSDLDAAILDIDLGGRGIWPVAQVLRDRGIPVVFATGFSGSDLRPEEFRQVPTVRKPLHSEQLVATLRTATSRSR
ncbi:MAG TPA: HWE histidine kinase domain-containing protein [Steroidobacteraceae bacterium]|nr:HWE histidine kinase domain-containing protein [Steroidobacteraceae bacterium]